MLYDNHFMVDFSEKTLWEKAIFVFDTSALINLYAFNTNYQTYICDRIFNKLNNRLWISDHIYFEYEKLKRTTRVSTLKNKYQTIEQKLGEIKKSSNKSFSIMEKNIDIIERAINKEDRHPYLGSEITILREAMGLQNDIDSKLNEIQDQINNRIEAVLKEDDDVYDSILACFDIGGSLDYQRIIEIMHDAKFRHEMKIPPGYSDFLKKDGFQKAGDLIIWYEIMDLSRESEKPIILITDEMKKTNDWCRLDTRGRIDSPREELIQEFYSNAEQYFWMYNLDQFLYLSKEYINTNIKKEEIDKIHISKDTKKSIHIQRIERSIESNMGDVSVEIIDSIEGNLPEKVAEYLESNRHDIESIDIHSIKVEYNSFDVDLWRVDSLSSAEKDCHIHMDFAVSSNTSLEYTDLSKSTYDKEENTHIGSEMKSDSVILTIGVDVSADILYGILEGDSYGELDIHNVQIRGINYVHGF